MALTLTVFNQLSRKCQTYKTTLQPLSRTPHALYQYNYPFLRGSLLTYVVLAAVASIALDVSELPACQLFLKVAHARFYPPRGKQIGVATHE